MKNNYFERLNAVSYTDELKKKLNLSYLPWARACAELMKVDPFAEFGPVEYTPKIVTSNGNVVDGEPRLYFTDGKTCWVKTYVTVHRSALTGDEKDTETFTRYCMLPVMNQRNVAIKTEEVTSTDINKAFWRCITKNIALFGIALHVYNGEEASDEDQAIKKLQTDCMDLIKKKCAIGDKQKEKVATIAKGVLEAENGNPQLCNDKDRLTELKQKLLAIR